MCKESNTSNSYNPLYLYKLPSLVFNYDSQLLCDKAKLLYCLIISLSYRTGCCMVSDDYFIDIYGYARRTVSRCISQLCDCGFIEIAYVNNNKRRRRIYPVNLEKAIKDKNNQLSEDARYIKEDLVRRKEKFNGRDIPNKLYFKQNDRNGQEGQRVELNSKSSCATGGVSHKPINAYSNAKNVNLHTPNNAASLATHGEHSIYNSIDRSINKSTKPIKNLSFEEDDQNHEIKPKPESLKEVEDYVESFRANGAPYVVPAKDFYNYYESKGWKQKGMDVTDWKAEYGYYCAVEYLRRKND